MGHHEWDQQGMPGTQGTAMTRGWHCPQPAGTGAQGREEVVFPPSVLLQWPGWTPQGRRTLWGWGRGAKGQSRLKGWT